MIFYTQGGFTETSRDNLVRQAKLSGQKSKTLLAKEYDGENFYKYKGETDPFENQKSVNESTLEQEIDDFFMIPS